MKRKFFSIFLTLAISASLLAGCGGGAGNATNDTIAENTTEAAIENTTEAAASSDAIELTVWESVGGPDEFIEQASQIFTEQNPNITIKFVNVELGDAAGQIALDGPAGIGPDLFAAPHDKLGELFSGGHVLPTSNVDRVSSDVLAACASALTYEGTMYGYPVSAETYALFYNKDLISDEDVPKTWEEVKSFCEGFNSGDKYGFMMDVKNAYYSIIFTTGQNNRLFGPEGTDTTKTNINSPASVEGMQYFQGLRSILNVPSADLGTEFTDGAFSAGSVAMYITGPWNIKNFEDAGLNFGVAPLPSLPGNSDPVASFSGTRAMFVSAYSAYPEEAAKFAEFLISPEMQKLRFDITGALPSVDIEVESPYIAGFTKQLQFAFPMPSIPQMGKYWDAMGAASANIWDGADVQTELDACDSAILSE